ncbi:FHA domain-containing protein [Bailinhaonella thermotolerans]|uniref:FHA domain-containing protein n=1 Tax=Bailinhaonella thermotolerans TaxID=1070861 RepID=A0A3A4B1K0_9ACTN|nr:FHA domain-containing protein [Bailinhaonella thermotolerans]RJL34038.1 FHA domain-containing protein [Bailinhaonella thermotolerans]
MATCPDGHASADPEYCDVCGARIAPSPAPSSAPSPAAGSPAFPAPPAAAGSGEPCPDCGVPRTGRFCEDCGYDFDLRTPPASPAPAPPGPAGAGGPAGAPPAPGPASGTAGGPAPAAPPGAGTTGTTGTGTTGTGTTGTGTTGGPAGSAGSAVAPGAGGPGAAGASRTAGGAAGGGTGRWEAVITADREYYETVIEEGEIDRAAFPFPPYCPERRVTLAGPYVRIGRRGSGPGDAPEIDLGTPPADPGVSHVHAVLIEQPDGSWRLVDPGSTNGTKVNGGPGVIAVNTEVPLADGDRVHLGVWTTITLRRG